MIKSLRIASYNVHKGVGTDRRRDPSRISAVIEHLDADIIALQEVDRRFGARNGVLDLRSIQERTGLRPIAPVERKGAMADGWHGNLLLVRGFDETRVQALSLPGLEPRGAICADLLRGDLRLRVIAVHLGLLPGSRKRQAEMIARRCTWGGATVVLGDMNEWKQGPSSPLAPLYEALDIPRARSAASFPSRRPVLALDRILAGRGARVSDLASVRDRRARQASDHLPLTARLELRGADWLNRSALDVERQDLT